MITIAECTELPSSFDSFFEQSLPFLEAGTFDWRYLNLDNSSDNNLKKEKLREKYQEHIEKSNCKVIYGKKDEHPIFIFAGCFLYDPTYIMFNYALYGADKEGSKSWLHGSDFINATKNFYKDTLGLSGYRITCNKDSSLYNHHMNRKNPYNCTVSLEATLSPPLASDKTIAIIKHTYT